VGSDGKTLLTTKRFRVEEVSQTLPNGKVHQRAIIRHPGAVSVIPMIDSEHVCLIRNYRVAVGETLIEIPAGTLETNEPPEKTAERELIEETGYRADRITKLHSFFLSPGVIDEHMHLFVAEGLEEVGAEREEGEEIENWIVSWKEAIDMVYNGKIKDAKTIVGLLYFDRMRK
jgi:ADP-ribose pyrophosphatase